MTDRHQTDKDAMSDEEFIALQQEISALYKQQALERPSAAIDAAILLQAKATQASSLKNNVKTAEKSNLVQLSFWKKHRLPISSAASVMLIASVMLLNPEFKQHAVSELDGSVPVMSDVAAPVQMAAPVQTAEPATVKAPVMDATGVTSSEAAYMSESKNTPMPQARVQGFDAQIPQTNKAGVRGQMKMESAEGVSVGEALTSSSSTEPRLERTDIERNRTELDRTAPRMHVDSAEKAVMQLSELVESEDYVQAERYMLTIEQRFPNIVNPQHPQYDAFKKLKQQLTSQ
ncbi:hypothetical protein BCU84_05015 [Shewanella sp. 10N.286.51.B7]|uniref:hypothetical protein n=1 Tax=Shewanella sp. 10N.286.51.B7 TaxID=1880836 RepID=UPI000C83F113|nr:hypothetical protein [Shewanella sp. 10N.286.51.B7]PMG79666.1 hypothetical protein BCU84_05015 [Shewanella sp. 10N.286.51.B7]